MCTRFAGLEEASGKGAPASVEVEATKMTPTAAQYDLAVEVIHKVDNKPLVELVQSADVTKLHVAYCFCLVSRRPRHVGSPNLAYSKGATHKSGASLRHPDIGRGGEKAPGVLSLIVIFFVIFAPWCDLCDRCDVSDPVRKCN